MLRTVFFGTPSFAVPTLDALVAAGLAPALVISQPDRPVGRGRPMRRTPVAEAAERHGLTLAQPESVRDPGFLDRLAAVAPDVAVVVAFGQIFRRALLEMPRHGSINLHASLLPRWRGAAPIQAAIAAGDRQTGVTTMQMDVGLDSGPILLQDVVTIGADETHPELAERLASKGASLLALTLTRLGRHDLSPREQGAEGVTLAPRLAKTDGAVRWHDPASRVYDRWRAYLPWPGTTAVHAGEALKIIAMRRSATVTDAQPGTVLGRTTDDAVAVACGGGSMVDLVSVQRPGRSAISAAAWRNGRRVADGDRFAPGPGAAGD